MLSNLKFSYSVSNVKDTKSANQQVNFLQIVNLITKTKPTKDYEKIKELTKKGINNGLPLNEIKKQINPLKQKLPFFLLSGYQAFGHDNNSIEYNSCVQIDIDMKEKNGDKLALEVKEQLKDLSYILFAGISPSGYGVKALVKTDNQDKLKHLQVAKQIVKSISNQLKLNEKYFDIIPVSQPSFCFYDKDLFVNVNAKSFLIKEDNAIEQPNFLLNLKSKDSEKGCNMAFEHAMKTKKSDNLSVPVLQLFIPHVIRYGINKDYVINYLLSKGYSNALKKKNNKKLKAINDMYKRYAHTFGTWSLKYSIEDYQKEYSKEINLTENQFISDVDLTINHNALLMAPVGSGKTYWVSKQEGRKILVVPTQGLVRQCVEDYNATPYYEDNKEISDFIAVTYASLPHLADQINLNEYDLYIDESHNFTTSSSESFLLDEMNNILSFLPIAKKYILLTATPVFSYEELINDLPIIKINKPNQKNKTVQIIEYNSLLGTLKDLVTKSVDEGRFASVLLNNTKEDGLLGKIQTTLSEMNGQVLNSTKKYTEEYHNTIVKGEIEDDCQWMVFTTVLKEGVNISKHKKSIDIFVIGNFHPIELEQIAARFRNAENLNLICLKKFKEDNNRNKEFNYDFKKFKIQKTAKHLMNAASSLNELGCEFLNNTGFNFIKSTYDGPVMDTLSMSYHLFNYEKTYLNNNNKAFIELLSQWNWVSNGDELINQSELSESEKAEINAVQKESRRLKEEEIELILNRIKEESDFEHITKYETCKTKLEKDIRYKVLYISSYVDDLDKAIEIVKNNYSAGKWNQLVRKIQIIKLKSNQQFMNENNKISIFIKAIYNYFKLNNQYHSEEIQSVINRFRKTILNQNKSWSKTICTRYLQSFMNIEKTLRRGENKHEQVIIPVSYSTLDLNLERVKTKWVKQSDFIELLT